MLLKFSFIQLLLIVNTFIYSSNALYAYCGKKNNGNNDKPGCIYKYNEYYCPNSSGGCNFSKNCNYCEITDSIDTRSSYQNWCEKDGYSVFFASSTFGFISEC